jgi:hypothetical protein
MCTTAIPVLAMTLFMSMYYFFLIMNGSNKKIKAAIEKFEKKNKREYKNNDSFPSKIGKLCSFLFWDSIPASELV